MDRLSTSSNILRKEEYNEIHASANPTSKQPSSPLTPVRRRFLATVERRKSVQLNSGGLALGQTDEDNVQEPVKFAMTKKTRELVDRAPIFMSGRKNCLCFGANLGCRCFSCMKISSTKNKENYAKIHRSPPINHVPCEIHDSIWPSLSYPAGLSSDDWKKPKSETKVVKPVTYSNGVEFDENSDSTDDLDFDISTADEEKMAHNDETDASSPDEKTIYDEHPNFKYEDETYSSSACHPYTLFKKCTTMFFPSLPTKISTTTCTSNRSSPRQTYKSESRFVIKKRFRSRAVPRRISVILPEGHVQKLTAFYEEKTSD